MARQKKINIVDSKEKHIEVNIPAGIRQGQKVRLKGMGGHGRNGGRNGDIYLHVELLPHPLLRVLLFFQGLYLFLTYINILADF